MPKKAKILPQMGLTVARPHLLLNRYWQLTAIGVQVESFLFLKAWPLQASYAPVCASSSIRVWTAPTRLLDLVSYKKNTK